MYSFVMCCMLSINNRPCATTCSSLLSGGKISLRVGWCAKTCLKANGICSAFKTHVFLQVFPPLMCIHVIFYCLYQWLVWPPVSCLPEDARSLSFWQAICILPVWDSPCDWKLKYSSKKCLTALVQIHALRKASFYCSSIVFFFFLVIFYYDI